MEKRYLIEEYLKKCHMGEENAIHSRELEALFSLTGRALRRFVSELRKEEIPICSGKCGYYYARTQAEIKRCAGMLGDFADGVSSTRMSLLSSRAPNVFGNYVSVSIPTARKMLDVIKGFGILKVDTESTKSYLYGLDLDEIDKILV